MRFSAQHFEVVDKAEALRALHIAGLKDQDKTRAQDGTLEDSANSSTSTQNGKRRNPESAE